MRRSILTAGLTATLLVGGLIAPAMAEDPIPSPDTTAASQAATDGVTDPAAAPASDPAPAVTESTGPATDPTAAATDPAADPTTTADATPTPDIVPTPAPTVAGDPGMTAENTQYSDEASIVAISRNGCVITFEVAIAEAGTYTIEVWDDGKMVGSPTVTGAAGSTQTVTYTMGANVGTIAWGYDFVLSSAANSEIQWIDWNFEGSEQVMTQCAAAAVSASATPAATTSTTSTTPQLARTGTAAVTLGMGAMVLIAAGGLALRSARRRA